VARNSRRPRGIRPSVNQALLTALMLLIATLLGCREPAVELRADPALVNLPVDVVATATPPPPAIAEPAPQMGAVVTSAAPRNHRSRLLWWEGEGMDEHLVVDADAIGRLTDPERAVVGYVAARVATHCKLDAGREAVRCPLTDALGLGAQCGRAHAALVQRWLSQDLPDRCDATLFTAFKQGAYEEVTLSSQGSRHTVTYDAVFTLGPGRTTWIWQETLVFGPARDGGDALALISRRITRGAPPPKRVWLAPWWDRHFDLD